MPSLRRSILNRLGAHGVWPALVGVAAAFLLANVLTACFILSTPGRRVDPAVGEVWRAGTIVSGTEGYGVSHWGADGTREVTRSSKDASSPTVLFLGDSFTEALYVNDSQTFVQILQDRLGAVTGGAKMVNAAVAEGNPAKYIDLASAYRKRYDPAVTVVQLNEYDIGPELMTPTVSHWLESSGDSWTVESTQPGQLEVLAGRILSPVPALYRLAQRLKAGGGADAQGSSDATGSTDSPAGATPDPRLVAWLVKELAAKYGDRLVVLWIPAVDYFGTTSEPTAMELAVKEEAARQGVVFVDPRAQLAADYEQTRQPAYGFANTQPGRGHINSRGHRIIAEVLSPVLGKLLAEQAQSGLN